MLLRGYQFASQEVFHNGKIYTKIIAEKWRFFGVDVDSRNFWFALYHLFSNVWIMLKKGLQTILRYIARLKEMDYVEDFFG